MEVSIKNARLVAQTLKTTLDCKGLDLQKGKNQEAVNAMKNQFGISLKNPTLGLMAEKRDIFDVKKENPRAFRKNYLSVINTPEIVGLREQFDKKFKETLYPRTWKNRLKIIRNERITFYGTKEIFSFKKLLRGLLK